MTEPTLRDMGWAVLRDVNRTLGGGTASMELMRRTFIARGWLDTSTNAVLFAISRLTPGTNVLAYCVGVGWRVRRMKGSVVALVAASVPASLVIWGIAAAVGRLDQYRIVQMLLAVGILAAVALVCSSAWHISRPYFTRGTIVRTAIIAGAAAMLLLSGVTPVRILLVAAAIGFAWPSRGDAARVRAVAGNVAQAE